MLTRDSSTIGRGSAPGESPPLFEANYLAGHITGYLSDVAVYGPYRTQLDAAASSLGYSIGKWPLVPLVGQVVKDNPGLLEVYVEVRAFKSDAGANSWLSSLAGSYALADYKVVPPPDNNVALAVEGTLGQDDGFHEHIVFYDVQVASQCSAWPIKAARASPRPWWRPSRGSDRTIRAGLRASQGLAVVPLKRA